MNKQLRQFARESHLDVYGLGKDLAKWEACLEKFASLVVQGYITKMENEMAVLKSRVNDMEKEK